MSNPSYNECDEIIFEFMRYVMCDNNEQKTSDRECKSECENASASVRVRERGRERARARVRVQVQERM